MATTAVMSPMKRWKQEAGIGPDTVHQDIRKRFLAVNQKIDQIDSKIEKLLPLESGTRSEFKRQWTELRKEQDGLARQLFDLKKLKTLDPAPLKWRDERGFPSFIILDESTNVFQLAMEGSRRDSFGTTYFRLLTSPGSLPSSIIRYYQELVGRLFCQARESGETISLSSDFKGFVPADTKVIMKVAKDHFDGVFLIAEAQNWKLDKKPARIQHDPCPLVVGWRRKGEKLYLIDHFDLTSVESYIRKEFSIDPEPE